MDDREQAMTDLPEYVAPRTCTVVEEHDLRPDKGKQSPLTAYADMGAYVLIAEPGAGKTTAFENEALKAGAVCVSVRDFRALDRSEWAGKTLFLDGLDESRAGAVDGRTPLDEIRTKLDRLGCPSFRLSCRWADWLAANDRERLQEVSPDGEVTVIRLDPLSERNVEDILEKNHGVEDAEGFIAAAKSRGIGALLSNPQNLELIARAVAGGKWPDSRKEMFEEACRLLARETNGEHLAAIPTVAETDPLIDAAGRLCAAQLLSGNAGYTLPDRAEPDVEYPSLAVIGNDAGGRARQALGTRLFVGVSEGRLAPAHRQIAEYLAARHVSGLVDRELPLARVLALITGFDGEVLPAFRNFLSWLAVHNKRSRKRIMRLEPSGLIYAGDRETYSTEEKREIVVNLRREWIWNPWCSRSTGRVAGFGRIVSPELEDTFKEILSDADRGHGHQCYVLLLMQMLADGDPLPALTGPLLGTVRDASWYQDVRCGALAVLTGYSEGGCLGSDVLETLLGEIDTGSVEDPEDELLGILLKSLYPRMLPMAEVLKYLREPRLKAMAGEYSRFWTKHVRRESTQEQLAELLDGIAASFEICRGFMSGEVGRYTRMARLPVEALEEAIRPRRGRIAVDRLYRWLGIFSGNGCEPLEREIARLRFYLEWDAEVLKGLIAHAVETCLAGGQDCADVIDRRLFGARPFRYGQWCMEMATAATDPKAASFYLRELHICMSDGGRADGLTVESARAGLAENESLQSEFDRMCGRAAVPASHHVAGESADGRAEERPRTVTPTAAPWSMPKAVDVDPRLLNRAAEAYLGIAGDSEGGTPQQRLRDFAGGSPEAADAVLTAIEGTVDHASLPDCDDVVQLFDEQKVDLLVLPLMAGLHSLEQSDRLSVGDLNEGLIRLAITILYTLPRQAVDPDNADGFGVYRPEWFRALLRDDSALVADVLCRTAARKLKTGLQQPTELHELASAADHEAVARLAAVRVLECFRKAETEAALVGLCMSLRAALAYCEWSAVERVVGERLYEREIAAEERNCWLVAGYLTSPERHREEFQALADDEGALKWLARFLSFGRVRSDLARRLAVNDLVDLVAAAGVAYRNHGLTEDGYRSIENELGKIADDTSAAATEALLKLSEDRNAEPWQPMIAHTTAFQARRRREQEYVHCNIRLVVETLANRRPANAADLAALVLDELSEISRKIRDGSTSDWRQHWNVDSYNHALNPKPEDACRDAILSDLQDRLVRLDVDAQPEGVYRNDKRADVRVGFAGFNVPVEIKRSCHRDLWTAMQEQLIADYTRSPGAAGHGIYLVFWFGDVEGCRPTSYSHWTPKEAEDVRRKLKELLPERESGLISICVVDVSVPAGKQRGTASPARTVD